MWVILAVAAGICEEFMFRGYLQKQFLAITGSDAAAVVLQAFFGVAHSYQGVGHGHDWSVWCAFRNVRGVSQEFAAGNDSAFYAGFVCRVRVRTEALGKLPAG